MEERFFVKRRKGNWVVGLLILIGIVLLAYLIFTVGQEEGLFISKVRFRTRFKQVSGLLTDAPVRLEGYGIGSVQEINFVEDGEGNLNLEVVFDIDMKVRNYIREDSRCYIGSIGLLGDKFLGVYAGEPEYPLAQENELLSSIEPIEVQEIITKGSKVFDDIEQSMMDLKEISHKLNTGKGTLGKLINDPILYIDLQTLAKAMEDIAVSIKSGDGTVSALFNERELYDSLVVASGKFNELLDLLSDGEGSFQRFLKSDTLYKSIEGSAMDIEELIRGIKEGEGDVGAFMTEKEIHTKLNRVIDDLDSLIRDLKKNPSKFIKFSIF